MLPALVGEYYFASRPKGISLQRLLFGTCSGTFATTKNTLWPSKSSCETQCFFNILTFRTLLVRVCTKIAYLSKYTPRSSRKHILANRVQQKSNFSNWMCLRMPSCRIWAAKQISKIPCKYVYYLHMGGSWGSLRFFAASNFLIFIILYFSSWFPANDAGLLWGFLTSLAGNY